MPCALAPKRLNESASVFWHAIAAVERSGGGGRVELDVDVVEPAAVVVVTSVVDVEVVVATVDDVVLVVVVDVPGAMKRSPAWGKSLTVSTVPTIVSVAVSRMLSVELPLLTT